MSKYRELPYVIRIEASRRLQRTPELNTFPEKPFVNVSVVAETPIPTLTTSVGWQEQRLPGLDSYPVFAPHSAYTPVTAHIRHERRHERRLPQHDSYPVFAPHGAYTPVEKYTSRHEQQEQFNLPIPTVAGVFNPRVDHYAWYDNDSADADATTIIGSEDNSQSLELDTDYHLRIKVSNFGHESTAGMQLQYDIDGAGSWANVDGSSANVRTVLGLPNDGEPTAERLSTTLGSFVPGRYDEIDGLADGITHTASSSTEHVFCLQFRGVDLAGTETITFRLLVGGSVFPHTVTPTTALGGEASTFPVSAYESAEAIISRSRLRHVIDKPAQIAPEHSVWTATPASTKKGPGRIPQLHIRTFPSRRFQRLPEQLADTGSPTAPRADGEHPGSGLVKAFRSAFRFTLQTVDYPDEYPLATPPAAEPHAAYQRVDALIPRPTAQYLQPTRLSSFRKTDPAYYTGWYPAGYAAEKAHKVWFERKHLRLPHPEDPSVTSTSAAEPPAYFLPKQHERHEKRKHVELPELDIYTRTIQSPAAYAPVDTIRRRDTARILRFPERLDERPQTPAVAEQPPTSFLAPVTHRRHGKTNIVLLPEFPDRKISIFPTPIKQAVNHVWHWDLYRKRA